VREYLREYERADLPYKVARLGCRVRETRARPRSGGGRHRPWGIEAYVHLPNFLIVAADKA